MEKKLYSSRYTTTRSLPRCNPTDLTSPPTRTNRTSLGHGCPAPLNRGMNIRQLIEGQKEQIISLSPSSPLTLFFPTDIDGAVDLLMQQNRLNQYPVVPALKYAVLHGDAVVQFYGQGKYLQASRMNEGDNQYPDSFNPLVSHKLLSGDPLVYYTGLILPANIDIILVMQDGSPMPMSPPEFLKYAINDQANQRRQQVA